LSGIYRANSRSAGGGQIKSASPVIGSVGILIPRSAAHVISLAGRCHVHVVGVSHPADAIREHHTQKARRMRERVVDCVNDAARGCDQVEFCEAEKFY
jgi:hypothetical protein